MAKGQISCNIPACSSCVINYVLLRTFYCPSMKNKCALTKKELNLSVKWIISILSTSS